ncbi:hypothetical protein W97_00541 [Coniosporium apollinis CBS 100218]|uniref:Transcription factor domain-containing protein n=1 Tax=Coniosporium apollinis (strain CBS 100218) TaxID=1168221 RepID=R7YHF7_CONA1|nr:uncharacterized protein W97_00541 [Coniosporium apollinis CBS 100218]EON61328.1 hypothetical protein W97_00541 [Coniosporium apollinis CBS 100218]
MLPSDAGSTTANKRRRLNDHPHHDLQFSDLFSAGLLPTPSTPADSSFQFATQSVDGTGGTPLGSIDFSHWSLDEFSHDPVYLASQEELRCLLFSTAQSAAPTRAGSPAGGTEDEDNMPHQMREILSSSKRVEYLKNYIGQVAPWLDMFDSRHAFGIQLPALARNSPALLYAILAISARQMERKRGAQDSFDSIELYQEAIRLLTPLLQVRDQKVIATCVLLCCLEMMSASAQDWRRHLEGCAALFDAFGIHGFGNELPQAVFWCYARMDLCGALISDGTQSTLLEPSKWLPLESCHNEAAGLFLKSESPDMHANYAVYLCSKVCELVSDRTKYTELGEENGCTGQAFADRWLALWQDLQNWLTHRPTELLPVQTIDSKPFPQILFVHWAAISSNQLQHTACILLLNTMPRPMKLGLGSSGSMLWHAKRICGISLTNPHQGCLNNAIQPLWIAGRLLSHKSEHALIVKLIRAIESLSGWGTCWRIRDLEIAWGYKVRRDGREEKANRPS